ncbi:MAG: EAL domain-containing protein [Lachnospira sp.]|nr:EAL domain-containing protein [Lachnospira sp.]
MKTFLLEDSNIMLKIDGISNEKVVYALIFVLIIGLLIEMFIISKLNIKRNKVKQMAYVDHITGGWNMNRFKTYIIENDVLKKNCAIGYVNIKNFRYINDMYGIEKGNEILRNVMSKIGDIVQDDGCYAREVADKFVFCIRYIDKNTLLYVLNSYLATLDIVLSNDEKIKLVCNCGVCFKEEDDDLQLMLDKAEIALKNIRESKIGKVAAFDQNYAVKLEKNQSMTVLMEKALANNEFKVYIQPKVDFATGKVIGGEALIRWISKELGFVSPGEFIPLFEKNGFVTEVDKYVLTQICEYIQKLVNEDKRIVPISVNQSRNNLSKPYYVNEIKEIVDSYNVPTGYIELELTEYVFEDMSVEIVGLINKLRRVGFSIAIDDFGSGYSSLNLLKDVSFDVLKIDRIFLVQTENSERSKYIIGKIIELAHGLDSKVVCEGVETIEQVNMLKSMGCDIAQGYFYAKPMPIEDFYEYMMTH